MKLRLAFHVVSVFVLAAVVAAAQAPNDKAKPAQTNANRQSSTPSISEREASSGMATGRRQHQPVTITAREAGSGMATGRRMDAPESESATPAATSDSGVTTARETGSGMATGRKSGSVIMHDREPDTAARETGSGMATGKRYSTDPYVEERNSAHATESLDAASKDAAKMSQAQSNPLYKGDGLAGTNPLSQGKSRAAAPPSGNGSKPVVEYKDGEDGTMHTRPGNHKPGKMN